MSLADKVLRWGSGLFALNAVVVVLVSGLASMGDEQQLVEAPDITKPKVEVPHSPDDPPSLPAVKAQGLATGASASAPSAPSPEPPTDSGLPVVPAIPSAPSVQSAAGNMVLEEILRTIRTSAGELSVAPLEYPPLVSPKVAPAPAAAGQTTQMHSAASLEALGKRISSLKQLAITADTLMVEAQFLASQGLAHESLELLRQVSALRTMIAQLAASPQPPSSPEARASGQ